MPLAAMLVTTAVAFAAETRTSKAPVTVRLACAKNGSGKLQYVGKASDCPASRGKLVRFPQDFPVVACKSNKAPRVLFLVSDPTKCNAPKHPNSTPLTLPALEDIKLCIGTGAGTLRVVKDYSTCKPPERTAVLRKRPNSKPAVGTSAGSTPYTEGAAATAIDGALTVSDATDTHLERATAAIVAGFQSGDALVFANQLGISSSYNTGTGVLTLIGHATKSAYRTALRSVRFRTTNDNPGPSRTVRFTVNDGDIDSAPATKRIAITPVNDAPTLIATGELRYYTEGDGAVPIDPTLTLTDPDSTSISGATVQVGSGFASADDELAFTNQLGITGSYNDSTGTLTLTGTSSPANYQTALESVTYENVNQNPAGTKPISFQVTDAGPPNPTSNVATRTIKLLGDNDAPVVTASAGATSYDISDGTAMAIDAALAVDDVDDTNLESATVSITAGFQSGDTLAFSDQLGITGSYDSGTGVLTLTGTASKGDYQTALRSVTFNTTNGSPSSPKTVGFRANDGDTDSNDAFKDIALVP